MQDKQQMKMLKMMQCNIQRCEECCTSEAASANLITDVEAQLMESKVSRCPFKVDLSAMPC